MTFTSPSVKVASTQQIVSSLLFVSCFTKHFSRGKNLLLNRSQKKHEVLFSKPKIKFQNCPD